MTSAQPRSAASGAPSAVRRAWSQLSAWRRLAIGRDVDHATLIEGINAEAGWSVRYAFMTLMSAGIAILGLLQASPAVVIGAMLISPLMNPILGFGFALATFDFPQVKRSLGALSLGSVLAVAFTALIVLASPLKDATTEILSRTRPNLFDLLIALFAGLAGAFAIVRGQGGTIVGVAIATALMPPLAIVGYGVATWNLPVLGGALALFGTNFVTIALAATLMARLHGFGRNLSGQQGLAQSALLAATFIAVAIPLSLSLSRIASEAVTVNQVKSVLADQFGPASRITQLGVDFDAQPIVVRAVVIVPRAQSRPAVALRTSLQKRLDRTVALQIDQLLVGRPAESIAAQRERAKQAEASAAEVAVMANSQTERDRVAKAVAVASGVNPEAVLVDPQRRRASAKAAVLPGADLETYRSLEARAADAATGWSVTLVPPLVKLPTIRFASGSDQLDVAAREAVLTSAWAAKRWNANGLEIPGLSGSNPAHGRRPHLAERRGAAIADLLRTQDIIVKPAAAAGVAFRLSPVEELIP
jgi:uncharacterized hydrophobic protein (TIGR00271 family)